MLQCNSRADQDIWGHSRPVLGVGFICLERIDPLGKRRWWIFQFFSSFELGSERMNKVRATISLVIEVNLTSHLTSGERPCTTLQYICETSVKCHSNYRPVLVGLTALSHIEPQVPPLVCSSANSFKFQSCGHTPPGARKLGASRAKARWLKHLWYWPIV